MPSPLGRGDRPTTFFIHIPLPVRAVGEDSSPTQMKFVTPSIIANQLLLTVDREKENEVK